MGIHDLVSIFATHAVLRVLWAFLSVGLVKGCVLVAAAWLLSRWLCARQPARAHLVWLVTLIGLLLLPASWLAIAPVAIPPVLERAASAVGAPRPVPPLSADHLLGLAGTAGGYTALARQSLPGRVPPASWLVLAAWGSGAALLLLRAAVGRRAVRRRSLGFPLPAEGARTALSLQRALGIRAAVRLVASPRCAVPHTFGLLRPVVVLPAEAAGWTTARLRPVLLHELAHVKRRDSLYSGFAVVLTSVLWCFPPAWIAAHFLSRSKELACDRLVLEHGVQPHRYASEMLDLLKASGGRVWIAAACSSVGSRAAMRERILSVLKAGERKLGAARRFSLAAVALVCCLLPLLAVSFGAAPAAGAAPLVGTWTNPEYFGTYWTHTYAFQPEGSMAMCDRYDAGPTCVGRYVIERKWEDTLGARWYFMTTKATYYRYHEDAATVSYLLVRIDARGDRLDMETSLMTWPEHFGALGNYHYVFYRKE